MNEPLFANLNEKNCLIAQAEVKHNTFYLKIHLFQYMNSTKRISDNKNYKIKNKNRKWNKMNSRYNKKKILIVTE